PLHPPLADSVKQDSVLNLNNEVVKMRKEVKRVRALIIRKLTRHISALKKKKGKDADIERNQRRVARLLEEIHAIKTLVPDKVTKTALQENLIFEQVCKDPESSISDRAIARIATHPQFSKKIDGIKAAVKVFKEERSKEEKSSGKKKVEKTKKQRPHTDAAKESNDAEDKTVRSNIMKHCEADFVEASLDSSLSIIKVKVEQKSQEQETPKTDNRNKKISLVKHVEKTKPQNKSVEKKIAPKLLEVPLKSDMKAESDLDLSDGDEKEYFDDSTEERFHKQSSAESEESDNDFFVGKVSKFKKKKTKSTVEEVKKTLGESSNNPAQTDKVQRELEELESRLKSKVTSLNSVFCASLARSKTGKASDRNIDLDYVSQKEARGRSMFSHQVPAQPLHPSWEASKKRKEQQGQILAFQGKR
uniref:Serum response factor-binding protein 1 n=1 Tax=Neogobius melanostomus TaxID=47308 RepID=A0A8C6S4T4_9GOBI